LECLGGVSTAFFPSSRLWKRGVKCKREGVHGKTETEEKSISKEGGLLSRGRRRYGGLA